MTPSKGAVFYYTSNALHVALTPAALPTVYPLVGGDLSTWTQFVCVQDASGLDKMMVETAEHRCFDPGKPLVEAFPTGYIKADKVSLTVTYDPTFATVMRAAKLARTKLRLLFALALDETQTISPDRYAWKVYCTDSEPVLDSGGKPVDIKLEFELFDDTGVHEQGS